MTPPLVKTKMGPSPRAAHFCRAGAHVAVCADFPGPALVLACVSTCQRCDWLSHSDCG